MRCRPKGRASYIGIVAVTVVTACLEVAAIHLNPAVAENPFSQILNQNDQILNAINSLPPPASPTDLSDVTQNWNKVLPAAQRFVLLADFGSLAILDKETGLVWQRVMAGALTSWSAARQNCIAATTGGRRGWRLPSVHELASLVDPNATGAPVLPLGHPFVNVIHGVWSATEDTEDHLNAWIVNFNDGLTIPVGKFSAPNSRLCVRGPANADRY